MKQAGSHSYHELIDHSSITSHDKLISSFNIGSLPSLVQRERVISVNPNPCGTVTEGSKKEELKLPVPRTFGV
jgi:hypothetical protein